MHARFLKTLPPKNSRIQQTHTHSHTFPGASPGPVCSVILCIVFSKPPLLPFLSPPSSPLFSLGVFLLLIAHRSVIFRGPLHGTQTQSHLCVSPANHPIPKTHLYQNQNSFHLIFCIHIFSISSLLSLPFFPSSLFPAPS